METIGKIRRRHCVGKESISALARDLGLSRPSGRKHLKTIVSPKYERVNAYRSRLGGHQNQLEHWLDTDSHLARKQRRTARRLFEGLQSFGYTGAYDSVQRFVKRWKSKQSEPSVSQAFVPLIFGPGEVCQFDWSQEQVELGGVVQTIKVAHFRLAHSRQMFVVAYPRETQEMVLDAHNLAFAFFGGVPERMVYDNLKTVVDAIFVGKDRQFNRRFLALANHYLFEPVACTPASGWEKGQVENQVGNIREWLFTPRPVFADFAKLNAWLAERCRNLGLRKHPAAPERTIAAMFAEEQPQLRAITAPFDGYVEQMLRVSSTCLLRADRNRYSVPAAFAGKTVSMRLSAGRVIAVADGTVIADHSREFGRDRQICNPWHYLPVLERKPGALRNGAPFRDWDLPEPILEVWRRLMKQPKGDAALVDLLLVAREAGLDALEMACELALEAGVITGPVVMNALRRLIAPVRPAPVIAADQLRLTDEPAADCGRYDRLREPCHAK